MSARSIVLLAALGCGSKPAQPIVPVAAPVPAYASPTPITTPELFGRGAISTEAPEFAISFSPDGTVAYFDRATPDRSKFSIVASRYENGAWQPATELAFSTGEHRDADPFVTADGSRLYFSSNRPLEGRTDWNTWYVERRGDGWGEAILATGPVSAAENEVFVSVSRDGTIYYASNKGGEGNLYRARMGTEAAELLMISTALTKSNPAISPDGKVLVFAADRPGERPDLYASRAEGGTWTTPKLLARASSPFADFAPYISPDGKTLFFTSERPGIVAAQPEGRPPGDIYRIDLAAALE
jgi:Tol biopolymer transport system component